MFYSATLAWFCSAVDTTHTASGVSLAGIARECGIGRVLEVSWPNELPGLRDATRLADGILFAACKISADKPPLVMSPRDGSYLTDRFRTVLLRLQEAHS